MPSNYEVLDMHISQDLLGDSKEVFSENTEQCPQPIGMYTLILTLHCYVIVTRSMYVYHAVVTETNVDISMVKQKRFMKSNEHLISRANSLKKAFQQLIVHTERGFKFKLF